MTLVHNERTKLTATWLNGIAAAAVAVGGISPTIAAASGVMSFTLAAVNRVLMNLPECAGLEFFPEDKGGLKSSSGRKRTVPQMINR